jgi:transcriptional regulator with XRE-family HTH domain
LHGFNIIIRKKEAQMENITNEQINKVFGMIFQQYRLKNNLTQEKLAEELSKSTKTISQLETAKDGTSKKTDIDLMNFLVIAPNVLYKDFITNPELKQKIEISEKIDELSNDKIEALFKIIDILKGL